MYLLEKHKFALSGVILALATLAVFSPTFSISIFATLIFGVIAYLSPSWGISLAILTSTLGEFGRIELGGISFLILDLITPLILLVWILRKLIHKEKFLFDKVSGSLIVFWIIAFLSLVVGILSLSGGEFRFALLYFLRFVGVSSMLLVAREFGKKEMKKVWVSLLLASLLLALSGFVLLQLIPNFEEAGLADLGWDPHIGRLTSTFLDPNFAGGAFAFLLALIGGKFLQEKTFARQSLILTLGGILGVALLLTFSRSALLMLGMSGLILGICGDKRILLAMVIVGTLGLSVSSRLQERVGELVQSATSLGGSSQQVLDPTAQLRVDSWKEGLYLWKENPILGIGFGTYKFHQSFEDEESHASSGSDASLINVGATSGILGFLAFSIFLINLGSFAYHKKEWGFLSALGGILIHSIFVNSLFFPPLALYFFVSGGLATKQK